MTYNTGNPIGSTDPRDLFDNAENFDNAVNSTSNSFIDRLGVARKTLRGTVSTFESVYQGASSTPPTVRVSGAALSNGDIYFDTATNRMMAYANGVWYATETAGATDASLVSFTSMETSAPVVPVGTFLNRKERFGMERLTLRKVFGKAYSAYAGTPQQIRMVVFGDSLGGAKPAFIYKELMNMLGVGDGGVPTSGNAGQSTGLNPSVLAGTYATNPADEYTYWPTGPLRQIANGSNVKFVAGGVNPTFDRVVVYYVKEIGAGTMDVVVAGATVQSINASDTVVGLGKYTFTQTQAQSEVRLMGTGGNIRIIGVYRQLSTSEVEYYDSAIGGLSLNSAMSSAQCRALFQAWLTDLSPDLFTFEMDDDGGGTYSADLALLGNVLDAAAPVMDKLFIASTPAASSNKTTQRDEMELFCYNRGYHFFDGNTPVAPYSVLTGLGWQGDGVHPAIQCQVYLGGLLLRQLGLDGSVYRSTGKAYRNTVIPAVLAKNSYFAGSNGNVGFYTDPTFGFDWTMKFPRILTFTKTDAGAEAVVAQFSGSTATGPNILPTSWKWGSASATQSLSMNTSGYYQLQFIDTANSNSRLEVSVGALNIGGFVKTALPTSNNRTGTVIYVSNGAVDGSGCIAYSKGEGPTVWRRIVDDSVVS